VALCWIIRLSWHGSLSLSRMRIPDAPANAQNVRDCLPRSCGRWNLPACCVGWNDVAS